MLPLLRKAVMRILEPWGPIEYRELSLIYSSRNRASSIEEEVSYLSTYLLLLRLSSVTPLTSKFVHQCYNRIDKKDLHQ